MADVKVDAYAPRPYDLRDANEVKRLINETIGYMRVSLNQGTDFAGRRYAYEALQQINENHLAAQPQGGADELAVFAAAASRWSDPQRREPHCNVTAEEMLSAIWCHPARASAHRANAGDAEERVERVADAIRTSVARDDEGEFPPLFDLLGFSGENKTRTVCRAAAVAALAAMQERQP